MVTQARFSKRHRSYSRGGASKRVTCWHSTGMVYVAKDGLGTDQALEAWVQRGVDYIAAHPRTTRHAAPSVAAGSNQTGLNAASRHLQPFPRSPASSTVPSPPGTHSACLLRTFWDVHH